MSALQLAVEKSVEDRSSANTHLMELTERLATLTDMMRTEQQLLMKVAEGQVELKPVLERLGQQKTSGTFDDVTSGHIRNIDVSLKHMLEEVADGREQVLRDLKNEIKVLTKNRRQSEYTAEYRRLRGVRCRAAREHDSVQRITGRALSMPWRRCCLSSFSCSRSSCSPNSS